MADPMSSLTDEVSRECLVTRARRISRVLTGVYDQALRPFGINSPQFTLLVVIGRLGPASRAEIGRENHQDRSTLTRNLQLIIAEGWAEEVQSSADGRVRPIVLTAKGESLLQSAAPAWRTAQAQAATMLGAAGVGAVIDIAASLPAQAV